MENIKNDFPPEVGYVMRYDPMTGQPLPPEPIPEKPKRASERRDIAMVLILALLYVLLADTLLLVGAGLGAGILLCLIAIACTLYLRRRARRLTGYAAFCMLSLLALSVSLTFNSDAYLKLFILIACSVLFTVAVLECFSLRTREAGTVSAACDVFSLSLLRPFRELSEARYALFHAADRDGQIRKRRLGAVLIGLACAIPALLVLVPLLISSDAAFEGLLRGFYVESLGSHVTALLFGLFFALLLFSQLFYVSGTTEAPDKKTPGAGRVDKAAVISFLCVICLFYLLYLISQGAYFFSGFRGLLPRGFTFAEYARRGYFEMCAVCVINLGIILAAKRLMRTENGKTPIVIRVLLLFICIFSLTLVAISVSKMVLYIQNYGMTRLRILTTASMLVLAAIYVAVSLRLFVSGVSYMKVAVVAAAVTLTVLSYANVDRIVANYNTDAYLSGKLQRIDMDALSVLSEAKVPALIRLLDAPNPSDSKEACRQLFFEARMLFDVRRTGGSWSLTDLGYDVRGFTTTAAEARQEILRIWPRLSEMLQEYNIR